MAVALTRAHTHTLTLIHAPMHPRTRTRSPGKGKARPFVSMFLDRAKLAGILPRRAKAPPSVVPFHLGGASTGLFLSSHTRSRACSHGLSPMPATPAMQPSHSVSARHGRRAPTRARYPFLRLCF
jgi:hypothetical protein